MAHGKNPGPTDGVPDSVKQAEGTALHKLWKRYKKRTQAEFMESLGKSSGYLPQFFGGKRPITIQLAIAIADELKIEVADFSPRLAHEMDRAMEASEWPFKRISRAEYNSLTKAQKEAVEAFVVAYLPEPKKTPSRKFPHLV